MGHHGVVIFLGFEWWLPAGVDCGHGFLKFGGIWETSRVRYGLDCLNGRARF